MTTSLKRLLLWLSGAPEEPLVADAVTATPPATPAAVTPVAAPAEPALEYLAATPATGPVPVAALPAKETLLDTREVHVPAEPINDATAYGVEIVPADVPPGTPYWQAIRVHHLTSAENHGNHHIFLDALDEGGNRIFGAKAHITWPGGEQTITVDKPLNEPGTNFPLWKWQVAAAQMLDMPSDRVVNMHTGHPDEPPGTGNTLFHHSFEVDFQRATKGATAGSIISGEVANGAGRRVLLTLDGEIVGQTNVDAAGEYRFENVAAGVYVLVVEGAGVYSSPVTVDGSQAVTVNLVVRPPLPAGKVMERYVLFGTATSPRTAVYLSQVRDVLVAHQPTFGFDAEEATHAQQVVIIGELQDVSQDTEDALIAAESDVERIQGNAAEVAAALAQILNPGEPM